MLNPVWSQGQVLVPGNPPLTQDVVDLFRKGMEWMLDIQLTEQQRGQYQALFIEDWNKKDPAQKRRAIANWKRDFAWLGKLDQMTDAQRAQFRQKNQGQYLSRLRSSKSLDDRFLLAEYEKRHTLVAGDPPLLTHHMDQRLLFVEWLLDLSLTDHQGQEYQRLFIKEWNNADRSKKAAIVKQIEDWAPALAKLNLPSRNLNRAAFQPRFLAVWRKDGADVDDRWLLSLYETTYRPGGERNPVLVAGQPPLTQSQVDRYADYLEYVLDLSLSGLNKPKREILRDYVVKDWKKMDRAARQEFLDTLKKWEDIAQRPAERNEWGSAMRPKMLAQLRLARDDERSLWLLGLHDKEQRDFQARMELLKEQHRIQMEAWDRFMDAMLDTPRRRR
jgi:hypothetical protein